MDKILDLCPPIKWDGHTHTNFCRHGSAAQLSAYVDQALAAGFQRYSVTEHPPLPDKWVRDDHLMQELAMDRSELTRYLSDVEACKAAYAARIDVRVGLELDYLFERERFTLDLVDECGHRLEEAIVSVHFLPGKGGMRCVDFTPQDFAEGLVAYYGSMEKVVDTYFDHVESAVALAATLPVPTRLGHVSLIRKFGRVLPALDDAQIDERLRRLIPAIQAAGVGIDVNTAGLRKETCRTVYAPEWFVRVCRAQGIPCVFGSDAHRPEDVGAGWEEAASWLVDKGARM